MTLGVVIHGMTQETLEPPGGLTRASRRGDLGSPWRDLIHVTFGDSEFLSEAIRSDSIG